MFPYPYIKEAAKQFIDFCLTTPETKQLNFAIEIGDHAVGSIGITLGDDIYSKSAELGYWLGEEDWNKGYATQAIKDMRCIAFQKYGIARIFAGVFFGNTGSRRALEKCGFSLEGILRKSIFKNGRLLDSFMYSLIKEL